MLGARTPYLARSAPSLAGAASHVAGISHGSVVEQAMDGARADGEPFRNQIESSITAKLASAGTRTIVPTSPGRERRFAWASDSRTLMARPGCQQASHIDLDESR
jgi:hypothetical protein